MNKIKNKTKTKIRRSLTWVVNSFIRENSMPAPETRHMDGNICLLYWNKKNYAAIRKSGTAEWSTWGPLSGKRGERQSSYYSLTGMLRGKKAGISFSYLLDLEVILHTDPQERIITNVKATRKGTRNYFFVSNEYNKR